jgi:hypothetical protein
MKVVCRKCSAAYQAPRSLIGRTVHCRHCGESMRIYSADETVAGDSALAEAVASMGAARTLGVAPGANAAPADRPPAAAPRRAGTTPPAAPAAKPADEAEQAWARLLGEVDGACPRGPLPAAGTHGPAARHRTTRDNAPPAAGPVFALGPGARRAASVPRPVIYALVTLLTVSVLATVAIYVASRAAAPAATPAGATASGEAAAEP